MVGVTKYRALAGRAGAVLFTILSALLSSPSYTSIRGVAITLRTWLRIVLWTECAGALFCGFTLLSCFWYPADAEMVFFRMHFKGAMLQLIIAMLTVHFVWEWRRHLKELRSISPISN
jgi:hypothetical protein